MAIKFEDPTPPVPKGRLARQHIADSLRANPGQWALLGTWGNTDTANVIVWNLKRGGGGWTMFAKGDYEAQSRFMIGEMRIYARYVGPR